MQLVWEVKQEDVDLETDWLLAIVIIESESDFQVGKKKAKKLILLVTLTTTLISVFTLRSL